MEVVLIVLVLAALVVGLVAGWRWLQKHLGGIAKGVERIRQRIVALPGIRKLRGHYPRMARFVAARFARGEYLGLHLTIGFLVSVFGLVVFSLLTEDVINKDPITVLDVRVYEWLHAHATPYGYAGWSVLTTLGNGTTLAIIGLGVGILLALRRRWIVLGGWLAALIGTGVLDGAVKLAVRRPRPATAMDFLSHQSWSFPSGHSMGSLVTYGMLAYLLVLAFKGRKLLQMAIMLAALLLILAIGLSRMYLGVHYFSDVMGGFAAGVLWLSACMSGLEVARRVTPKAPAVPAQTAPQA